MSRIGDLIVRMQLKYQDYQKGLKQAEKDTKGFAGTLGKIKGVGLAVWGAIGASVTAMAKSFVNHSQIMSDKWASGVSQMKAVWDQLLTSLTSWDWEGFGQRIKDAMSAASASTAAHDAEFEVMNAIKMRKAAMADELAQLQILMRDTGKSYDERAKAAEEYLDKVKPIYDAEIDLRKQIYLVDTDEYLKNAGLQANADNRDLLRTFLTDVAPNGNLLAILNEYQKKVQGKKYELSQQDLKVVEDFYQKYGMNAGAALSVLAQYYQSTNDKIAQKVIEAIVRYDESIAMFNEETRKVQTLKNTANAHIANEQADDIAEAAEVIDRVSLELPKVTAVIGQAVSQAELPDIIPDGWLERNKAEVDAAMAELMRLQSITDEINYMIENAAVSALSGATQAFADCVAGIEGADASDVLAALMQPFANTMIQLGEMLIAEGIAIVAFKESLKSLNPYVALAAGTALLAAGAALSSGIKKLGATAGNGATTTSTGASGTAPRNNNIQSEMTIYVKGQLKGSDIVLSGKRTINDWSR